MRLVETHAHLDFEAFDADRDQVLARAREAGVETIVNVAIHPGVARRTLALAEAHPGVVAAVGIHPHEAASYAGDLAAAVAELERLASHPRVVALGEMGLDFYRHYAPAEDQRRVFEAQLDLAGRLGLPVIIHCRAAYDQVLDVLAGFDPARVVLHCFSADRETARRCAERGYYIGVGGVLTFPSAHALREIVAAYPRDRVVLETDCPFLAPQPRRGGRNEPALLTVIAEALGAVWGTSAADAAEITRRNALRLFGLA